MDDKMRFLIAVTKLFAFACICLLVVPVQLLILLFHKGPYSYIAPHWWHKAVCFIFRIKVNVRGTPSTNTQTLFLSNHISYLDIPAIATSIKVASFIAKKDVERWPVFGFLSKLQQTAFISRSKTDVERVTNDLSGMLNDNKNLILFPEGTSTDGIDVLPFKSSIFHIFLNENFKELVLQPMTVKVHEVNGHPPLNQEERDIYSWHVKMDMELPNHLWRFALNKGAVIDIIFHPVLLAQNYNNRKTLSQDCHRAVQNGLKGLDISAAA